MQGAAPTQTWRLPEKFRPLPAVVAAVVPVVQRYRTFAVPVAAAGVSDWSIEVTATGVPIVTAVGPAVLKRQLPVIVALRFREWVALAAKLGTLATRPAAARDRAIRVRFIF